MGRRQRTQAGRVDDDADLILTAELYNELCPDDDASDTGVSGPSQAAAELRVSFLAAFLLRRLAAVEEGWFEAVAWALSHPKAPEVTA